MTLDSIITPSESCLTVWVPLKTHELCALRIWHVADVGVPWDCVL